MFFNGAEDGHLRGGRKLISVGSTGPATPRWKARAQPVTARLAHRRPASLCARAVVGEMGLLCAPTDSLGHQGQPMKLPGSKPGR